MKEDMSRLAVKQVAGKAQSVIDYLLEAMPLGPGQVEMSEPELGKRLSEAQTETRAKMNEQGMDFETMLEMIRGS